MPVLKKRKKHLPERMCVICRRRFNKNELARYVRLENGAQGLTYDPDYRLPGRGYYLCGDAECRERFGTFPGRRKKCKGSQRV